MNKKASARQKNTEPNEDTDDLEKIMEQAESVIIGTIVKVDPKESDHETVTPENVVTNTNTLPASDDNTSQIPPGDMPESTKIGIDTVQTDTSQVLKNSSENILESETQSNRHLQDNITKTMPTLDNVTAQRETGVTMPTDASNNTENCVTPDNVAFQGVTSASDPTSVTKPTD